MVISPVLYKCLLYLDLIIISFCYCLFAQFFYSLNIHSISDIPQIILGWPKRCSVRCYRKIRMNFLANPMLSSQCLQIYFIFYNFNSMKKTFPKPSDLLHSALEACWVYSTAGIFWIAFQHNLISVGSPVF